MKVHCLYTLARLYTLVRAHTHTSGYTALCTSCLQKEQDADPDYEDDPDTKKRARIAGKAVSRCICDVLYIPGLRLYISMCTHTTQTQKKKQKGEADIESAAASTHVKKAGTKSDITGWWCPLSLVCTCCLYLDMRMLCEHAYTLKCVRN